MLHRNTEALLTTKSAASLGAFLLLVVPCSNYRKLAIPDSGLVMTEKSPVGIPLQ